MAQFRHEMFTYDGVNSRDYNLYICRTGTGESRLFGADRTIKEEESNNFIPTFQGVKYNAPTIRITLVCADNKGKVIPLDEERCFAINKWLFQDEYKPFTSYDNKDILYYAIFTKGANYEVGCKKGYLELEMRLDSGCAYSNLIYHSYVVNGSKTVEVINKSNIEKYSYPDVEFKILSGNSITVRNDTLGISMEFTNLPNKCHAYCYNEGLKHIVDKTNPDNNLRDNFNKVWLKTMYGANQITITGHCEINIISQNKIAIQ